MKMYCLTENINYESIRFINKYFCVLTIYTRVYIYMCVYILILSLNIFYLNIMLAVDINKTKRAVLRSRVSFV